MTRKGNALYEELIPRLLRKEQEILSCLSAREQKDFAAMLGKIEQSLDLVQTAQRGGCEGGVLRSLRHCERSAAIQMRSGSWIASASLAMTMKASQPLSICFAITGKYAPPEPASIASCKTLPISSAPRILMPASSASSSA